MAKKQTTSDSKKTPGQDAEKKPAKTAAVKTGKKEAKPVQPKRTKAKPKAAPAGESTTAPASARQAPSSTPSAEDIALRAYYIAEKRQKLGIPGDSANDWIEAERQLRAESGLDQ